MTTVLNALNVWEVIEKAWESVSKMPDSKFKQLLPLGYLLVAIGVAVFSIITINKIVDNYRADVATQRKEFLETLKTRDAMFMETIRKLTDK